MLLKSLSNPSPDFSDHIFDTKTKLYEIPTPLCIKIRIVSEMSVGKNTRETTE